MTKKAVLERIIQRSFQERQVLVVWSAVLLYGERKLANGVTSYNHLALEKVL